MQIKMHFPSSAFTVNQISLICALQKQSWHKLKVCCVYCNTWDAVCFLSVSSHLKFRSLWMTATVWLTLIALKLKFFLLHTLPWREVCVGGIVSASWLRIILSFSRPDGHKMDNFLRCTFHELTEHCLSWKMFTFARFCWTGLLFVLAVFDCSN